MSVLPVRTCKCKCHTIDDRCGVVPCCSEAGKKWPDWKSEKSHTLPFTLNDLMAFFFDASLRGYAGDGEFRQREEGLPEKDFYYTAIVRDVHLSYKDTYRRGGDFSSGETIIYYASDDSKSGSWSAIWTMSYGGWCRLEGKERIITHHKSALRSTYEARAFAAGRGTTETVEYAKQNGLWYQNIRASNNFAEFQGRESVFDTHENIPNAWRVAFWHNYQGMLLVHKDSFEQ